MYPLLLIVLGLIVLLLGKRLAVLGAAVGALLGAGLLNVLPGTAEPWVQWLTVGGLAVAGFFFAGLAKGIMNTVLLIIFALAGAAIALNLLELFEIDLGWLEFAAAFAGALVGWGVYSGFRDRALVIVAGLIGALLVTRGLVFLMPNLEGLAAAIIAAILAVVGISVQGGFLANRRDASAAQAQAAAAQAQAAAAQAQSAALQAQAAPPLAPATAAAVTSVESPVQAPPPTNDIEATPPAPSA